MRLCVGVLIVASLLTRLTFGQSPTDWPQWRGAQRDGRSTETGLLKQWPEKGPRVVWKVSHLGEGYSSLAVQGGRLFTQGNIDGQGFVLCLKAEDGAVVWKTHPPQEDAQYKHQKGNGARGTPTLDGDRAYVIGGGGDLTCLQTETGKVIWSKHFTSDLGGSRPGWGFSESPLIDGDRVIVTPGGSEGCVVALNKLTGEIVWRSSDVPDKAHYCSAIVVESHGVRQVIQFTGGGGKKSGRRNRQRDDNAATPNTEKPESEDSGGLTPRVVGLDAETGKLLWSYNKPANSTANVATPIFHNNRVFASSAYNTGGGLVQLSRSDDKFVADEIYFEKKMANHHGGIVLVDGFMYGFGSGGLICQNFETGAIVWQARSVSKGSLVYADGHLYCFGEKNEMALVEANSKEYVEKGRFEVDRGDYPTWAHPVVAGGRLYLRDMQNLTSYDIQAK